MIWVKAPFFKGGCQRQISTPITTRADLSIGWKKRVESKIVYAKNQSFLMVIIPSPYYLPRKHGASRGSHLWDARLAMAVGPDLADGDHQSATGAGVLVKFTR